jgi:MHS family proline/betaine transporter-like MFS transporter
MINKRKVTAAFLGTIVEYYDYSLYGFSASILAKNFFPHLDYITGLTYVFAVYAISYWAKPLGSLFFSKIGDKYGRMLSLKITIVGIAIPTVIIGLLPDYHSIGLISTQILVLCRFFQGFFVAGEYDGAAIYVIEHLGKKHHYTASALTRAMGVLGLLFGIAVTNFFNSSIFPTWCWRIPFLLSLPLACLTMYYRNFLEETPDFIKAKQESIEFHKLIDFVRKKWKLLLLIIVFSGGFGITYQVSIIFMKQYLPLILEESKHIITTFSILAVMSFGGAMPIAGICADYYGTKLVFTVSVLLTIISAISMCLGINYKLLNLTLASWLLLSIAVAPLNALAHGVIIKSFKSRERYRGVGLGHTIGSLLMSGTANYVCLSVMNNYNLILFPIIYIVIFSIISVIVVHRITNYSLNE